MANPSKQRGTAFETAVVDYLRTHGFPYAERRALRGSKDCGDIAGVPGVVIETKATKIIDLATAMNELAQEITNDQATAGIAIVKRRNKGVGEAYVIQTLEQWCAEHGDPS